MKPPSPIFLEAPWFTAFATTMKWQNGTWRGPCPRCGGTKRFALREAGSMGAKSTFAFCYDCHYTWRSSSNPTLSPTEILAIDAKEKAIEERVRKDLRRKRPDIQFHKTLLTSRRGQEAWEKAGIKNKQDWTRWNLGYGLFVSEEVLSIPYFDFCNNLVNLKLRYIERDHDPRYISYRKGLHPSLWWNGVNTPVAILVEGAKKAMVASILLGHRRTIIASNNDRLTDEEIRQTLCWNTIIYIPDPITHALEEVRVSQTKNVERNISLLTTGGAKVIWGRPSETTKLDDLGMTPPAFIAFLREICHV